MWRYGRENIWDKLSTVGGKAFRIHFALYHTWGLRSTRLWGLILIFLAKTPSSHLSIVGPTAGWRFGVRGHSTAVIYAFNNENRTVCCFTHKMLNRTIKAFCKKKWKKISGSCHLFQSAAGSMVPVKKTESIQRLRHITNMRCTCSFQPKIRIKSSFPLTL